jgi:hypothetical protein
MGGPACEFGDIGIPPIGIIGAGPTEEGALVSTTCFLPGSSCSGSVSSTEFSFRQAGLPMSPCELTG